MNTEIDTTTTNLTGHLIVIEKIKDGKVEYYSGEWLCIRQTESVLYCIKPVANYDGTNERAFLIIGNDPWRVVSKSDGSVCIRDLIAELPQFISQKNSEKPQWFGSVYANAESVLRTLKGIQNPKPSEFPKLPEGMEWHNPNNLTPKQVEVNQGWRLILKSEAGGSMPISSCDRWEHEKWQSGNYGANIAASYRTKLPLPEPKKRVPLEASDIPAPICWLKLKCQLQIDFTTMVITVGSAGIRTANQSGIIEYFTYGELKFKEAEYSSDRINWKPCYKEI